MSVDVNAGQCAVQSARNRYDNHLVASDEQDTLVGMALADRLWSLTGPPPQE
jgi:hypothetical protein